MKDDDKYKIDISCDSERYTELLTCLFEPKGISAYEYACALLRVGGLEAAGWDPLLESKEVFQDIMSLTRIDLDADTFQDVDKTKIRLMLLGYAHLIEMDTPYNVIANLLRINNGVPYCWDPFWDIRMKKKGKRKQVFDIRKGPIPVYPAQKIGMIKSLAVQAKMPQIGQAFDDFFEPVLRNSINHSDYVLHNDEFHILKGRIKDPTGTYTSIIPYSRLFEIIAKTYAFYWSFFSLEDAARHNFKGFKGNVFPFDTNLKGLLEFKIVEDDLLTGFTVHWPNKLCSYFIRDQEGCRCCNIRLGEYLTVDFFVGEYFTPHSKFSSLVPPDKEPTYSNSEYNDRPLKWSDTHYQP